MSHINLLRSFAPEETKFGTNESMDNGTWAKNPVGKCTFFQTDDQVILVIFSFNESWGCYELSFKTVLKYKVNGLIDAAMFASYLPDVDMSINCNRATNVFRKVVFVALTSIRDYQCVGFNGATPYLDRVYGRLYRLRYFSELLKKYSYSIINEGRNIFLKKVIN